MNNEAVIVKMTNGIALGGLTIQAWWPSLMQVSQVAGALVPILSALWLSLQIFKFFFMQKGKPHE